MSLNKVLSWTAVLLWMVLILKLSSEVAVQSDQLSTGITQVIVKTVKKVAPNTNFDIKSYNHHVRKNAHFFAYLILGVLVMNALSRSGIDGYKRIILALLNCILYAISDEVHQMFVPGRGPQVRDVFSDSAGVAVGIFVYLVLIKIKKKVMTIREFNC